MAIKKCYRLQADKGVIEVLSRRAFDILYEVDETFTTKREYIQIAERYTEYALRDTEVNILTWQDIFGEPVYRGWCKCTECGEEFWADQEHDCE